MGRRSEISIRTLMNSLVWIVCMSMLVSCQAAARGPEIGRLPELTSDDPSAEIELREAETLLAHGERDEASARYQAFLKKRPTDKLVPVAQLALGRIRLEENQLNEAQALFMAVAEHRDPSIAEHGRFYQGVTLERQGQHDQAILMLAPMVGRTIEPSDTALLLNTLADAYRNQSKYAEAILKLQALSEDNAPEADRKAARAQMVQLINERATPAEIRRLIEDLPEASFAYHNVALRALRDADAAHDMERTRELSAKFKDQGVPFDEEMTAIALRAEHPSDANPAAVGAILSLSGRARRVGELAVRGLMIAAGLPPEGPPRDNAPQVIFRDDAGDPARAVQAVEELVTAHRVIAIVGPMDANVALAAGKRAQELSVPLIALTPGGDLTGIGSMVFRLFPTPRTEAAALVAEAKQRGAKRFAVLYPESAYGEVMLSAFQAAVAEASATLAVTQSYAPGTTSFGRQAASLAKTPFDALFVPDAAQTLALVGPALAAADLWSTSPGQQAPGNGRSISVLAPSVGYDVNLPQLAGRYLQGAVFSAPFDPQSADGPALEFADQFKQRFNASPDSFAVFAHDAYALIRSAVDGGARSRVDLAARLTTLRHHGLVGPSEGFSATREALTPTRLVELKGDSFAPLTDHHAAD